MNTTEAKPMSKLQRALQTKDRVYSAAIDRLREVVEDNPETFACTTELREAVELVRCLLRIVGDRSVAEIHAAFGAPGDFGYDTPIGDALAQTYRGEP